MHYIKIKILLENIPQKLFPKIGTFHLTSFLPEYYAIKKFRKNHCSTCYEEAPISMCIFISEIFLVEIILINIPILNDGKF